MKIFSSGLIFLLSINIANAQWVKTNFFSPSKIGISQIYSDNGIIFLTAENSSVPGLFRSVDGGKTWDFANNGIDSVNGIIFLTKLISSKTTNHFFCLYQNSVFRSTNTGTNWTRISESLNFVQDITLDRFDHLVVSSLKGIFETTDEGNTWNDLMLGSNDSTFPFLHKIQFDQNNNIYGQDNNSSGSLYKYDSNTKKWTTTTPIPDGALIVDFVINSKGDILLYDREYDSKTCIYRSIDGGNSWQKLNANYNIRSLAINSRNDIFINCSSGIFLSSDNGETWATIYGQSVGDLFITDDGRIYINQDHVPVGVFVSSDYGISWNQLNFLDVPISAIAIGRENKIFAASSEQYSALFFTSDDRGNSWHKVNDIVGSTTSISCNENGRILTCSGNPFYSKDDGNSWSSYSVGVSVGIGVLLPNNIAFVGGYVNGQKVSSIRIYRSNIEGNTWTNILQDVYQKVKKLNASDNNFIFALTDSYAYYPGGGGAEYVIRSTDNGDTWQKVLVINNKDSWTRENWEYLESLGCSPNGSVFVSSSKGLYRTTDYGNSWNKIDSSITLSSLKNFVFNKSGNIFTNNGKCIFKSIDNGTTWRCIDSVLKVTAMAVDNEGYLYVGTDRQGIFRSADATSVGIDNTINHFLPAEYFLSQNYPNPFNPETKISYQLPVFEHVTLKVYDLLGREVAKLVDEAKEAGIYEVKFNGINLPSGVYFYRLKSGSFINTKKFVLMR